MGRGQLFLLLTYEKDCAIAFTIPAGYRVIGVDKLNKSLVNDCGSLVSTAIISGNHLIVHLKRTYNHNQEAAEKWNQLVAILDASVDFASAKVLLKRG